MPCMRVCVCVCVYYICHYENYITSALYHFNNYIYVALYGQYITIITVQMQHITYTM